MNVRASEDSSERFDVGEGVLTKTASFLSLALLTKRERGNRGMENNQGGQIMIRADVIRNGNGQIELSGTVLEATALRPKKYVVAANVARFGTPNELNLSGSQVLVGIYVLCTAGLLMWTLLRLWLFEQ
jgi:hypothetical protein